MSQHQQECDVVVLGLGPGGEHAAAVLAGKGLDVVAIDERLVGGECPYFGCVPSKMMIAAATALQQARRVPGLAGRADVRPDWGPVASRIRDEATDDWDDKVAVERLEAAGATFVRGRGTITAPREVTVDGTAYVARRGIVLNTGTTPGAPPIDGLAETPFWTNREIVKVTELPASLTVIGGGPIGCELAQVLATFGVAVTVVEVADRLIAVEEPEASDLLTRAFAAQGIEVVTGARIQRVEHAGDAFTVVLDDREIVSERLLVAAGRRNNLAGIGLEHVGLDPEARVLEPDQRMRVADGVWAVGDITGKGAFTHVSMYQADVVVRDVLGEDGPWADYRAVARATFTAPEIGSVGLSEAAARQQGLDVRVATGDLGSRGWLAKEEGLVKLVADRSRGVLVGACVVASTGGEVLSMLATAIHAEIPIATLAEMHFAYPTFYRAVQPVLRDLL
ncbi:NAD(P)/FAD-dependent oxidoreductase [Nocardioides marmoriginsengisoli]|uniref:NAD(P)/FAD-dependent oxidoreductase n=1 Tax=Nocardioides marmoriginsengisoli TaxID=661483 RepID=A0A3N0CMI5_9ACTN|nr:NAD(P)/FAD-dependent oxidoreductase [Nocardioides marmoriginsengisoli]RNL64113.1 NAD(P)/FAD-dependent oxidoreductase [Nocardioides marmoriginsengisoli]